MEELYAMPLDCPSCLMNLRGVFYKMKKIKIALSNCLFTAIYLLALSCNAQGTEDKKAALYKWDKLIKNHTPLFIEVDPTLPGFADNPFRQEIGVDSETYVHRTVSEKHEAGYLDCLVKSMGTRNERAPYEIALILRDKAANLKSQERFVKKRSEPGQVSSQTIFEDWKADLEELKTIPGKDVAQRILVLGRQKAKPICGDIFLDDPTSLLVLWGEKVAEQNLLADELIRLSADQGYPNALNAVGVNCEDKGDLTQAKGYFARAAAHGLSQAQFNYGLLLEQEGKISAADKQYAKAAKNGDPNALCKVALKREREGKFDEAKLICALVYTRLGKAGPALSPLARMLEKEGRFEDAEILCGSSESLGSVTLLKSMRAAGKLTQTAGWFTLSSDTPGDTEYLKGLSFLDQYKFKEAKDQMAIAAELGHPAAMVECGLLMVSLMNGDSISESSQAAAYGLFLKAHEMGYIPGTFNLAHHEKDPDKASALFRLSAEKGYPVDQKKIESIMRAVVNSLFSH